MELSISFHKVLLIAAASGAALLAASMELLGMWRWTYRLWFLASVVAAAPIAFALLVVAGLFGLPDSNGFTAIATWILAISATVGIFYGARTLRHVAEQTNLLTKQTSAAVAAAFPFLELYGPAARATGHWVRNQPSWVGTIQVASGTSLARDVSVWARDSDGHYFAEIGVMLPSARRRFDLGLASAGLAAKCPFPVMAPNPAPNDPMRVWVGIVWHNPDQSWEYNLIAGQRTANGDLANYIRDRRDPGFKQTG